ncbi:uncharacterized protein LOC119104719 [Pollicipes pollicipes]|uniref:uncharacterized protein LOC119104719 n=1 Tax=Pollicipes pollicipes TaxID=41117 RepID=UPI0018857C56|nr:uncharacterized protein LOC119104719 [Pollicipes pollicipes]
MSVTSRESVTVLGVVLCAALVTAEASKLPRFVTYGNDEEVSKCEDVLSYLCGETKDDRCVSPKDFCDGVTTCSSGWDEQKCDKTLPAYSKTEKKLKASRLYWISMSLAGCAKLCNNTPDCEGFSHHSTYKRCQIHTKEGEEANLNDKWTTYERTSPAGGVARRVI